MLPGASKGLYYLFVPKWEQLLNVEVWRKAAEQMFFSLGISWGGLIMFGSYNKFHNKVS
jgi:solute carrier family 6 amino acid transporter-like protein 5/7/9/14